MRPDQHQFAELEWLEGRIPKSTKYDDPYFSTENGLAESRYVFLRGNNLPSRFKDGFHIAELGFGSGLNMLAALSLWRASGLGGVLNYTSFEAYPMALPDMRKTLGMFPELADLTQIFLDAFERYGASFSLPGFHFELVVGDANETLEVWADMADAWFLDGFSPAKNPELWKPSLLAAVARHTKPGGSFATYSAAGHVRKNLKAAGFDLEKIKGFGRKRHMTIGRLSGES